MWGPMRQASAHTLSALLPVFLCDIACDGLKLKVYILCEAKAFAVHVMDIVVNC